MFQGGTAAAHLLSLFSLRLDFLLTSEAPHFIKVGLPKSFTIMSNREDDYGKEELERRTTHGSDPKTLGAIVGENNSVRPVCDLRW